MTATDDTPIKGIKAIKVTGQLNEPDDPTMPFTLEANFRPPEFMTFTFVALHGGSEEVLVRGDTVEALQQFITRNKLREHPRLRRLVITGPEGEIERLDRTKTATT